MTFQHDYPSCPLCGEAGAFLRAADCTAHPLWSPELPPRLEWHACGSCGHVYTRSFWTAAGHDLLFRRALPSQVAGGDIDHKRMTWQPVVRRAIDMLGGYREVGAASPAWIDAGCGDGGLVMTATDLGFDAIGVDARAGTVAALASLGFGAVQGDFMTAPLETGAAVVSMMDVLEHLAYPREALARAASIVRPGGVLVVSLPDRSSASWRVMDHLGANPYWHELEHHHNFTRERLAALVAESGFVVEDIAVAYRYKAQLEMYARRVAPAGG